MSVEIDYEPMEAWRYGESQRRRSPFRTHWNDTLKLLKRELRLLGASSAVIQLDVDRSQFRVDGSLRAQAKFCSPAVIVSFASRNGALSYPCDTFTDWHDNVRAVALALEALRAVDRYGVSGKGEQYRGWQQLPAPTRPDFRDSDEAARFVARLMGLPDEYASEIVKSQVVAERMLRAAEFKTHPDRGGNSLDFKQVQAARELLVGGV